MSSNIQYQIIYIQIIKQYFDVCIYKNKSYSLRAFAKYLEISPTGLSLILNKKRPLTLKMAVAWTTKLKLDDQRKQIFLEAVTRHNEERLNPNNLRAKALSEKLPYTQLPLDQFSLIAQWYHLAILNLINIKNFQHNHEWIAKKLGISADECKKAINRLIRLNLFEFKNNKYSRTKERIKTPTDIPSEAIKSYHRQSMKKALTSLDKDPVAERDITSLVLAIDKTKLAEAKKMISNFRKELTLFLDSSNADDVYAFNLQLFPLSLSNE